MTYEGKYKLMHPFLRLFKPKLLLYSGKKSGNLKGKLTIMRYQRKLNLVKEKQDELLLQMKVDFIVIDVILRFYKEGYLEGFLDTPIGNIHFTGIRMEV